MSKHGSKILKKTLKKIKKMSLNEYKELYNKTDNIDFKILNLDNKNFWDLLL